MADRVLRVRESANDELRKGIATIQQEQKVSVAFPPEVEAAAEQAAASPRMPDKDLTGLEFVTIDPAPSLDLDQAMHLERAGDGYVVHYAIADLAAFIRPGGPVDLEAHRRGETLYGADSKIPLHPQVLSEDAASLLPGKERPALVWTITLDQQGAITDSRVERARVRSRAKLSYDGVQADIAAGTAPAMIGILEEVGRLRLQQEADRGGISLPKPEQEIVIDGESWSLEFRQMQPVESWNAQISLLTGIAAASIMIAGSVGILRTLPPADQRAVTRLRRTAKALKVDWPADLGYPDLVRSLDPARSNHAAMVVACTTLLRGAGYVTFDGEVPKLPVHSALATTYAHVTAPLRRLVDRYGQECCVALCSGEPVPSWVTEALPGLPGTMQESGRRAHSYENAINDLVEAELLKDSVGEQFTAVVLEAEHDNPNKGEVQVAEPAVQAKVVSDRPLPVGKEATVTLVSADPTTRKVEFRL
ncbi:MAG: RNB domain-containing ribonuclease [Actinomycetota bacterium]|nr:RNB domain-containing ribonuclease [Actinomycetota bacterium]